MAPFFSLQTAQKVTLAGIYHCYLLTYLLTYRLKPLTTIWRVACRGLINHCYTVQDNCGSAHRRRSPRGWGAYSRILLPSYSPILSPLSFLSLLPVETGPSNPAGV